MEEARQQDSEESLFGEVIYSYSRKQAIEDGVLVDVTETAREAGFRYPFAMTSEVWSLIENIPRKYSDCEDVMGRLWDILMVAHFSVKSMGNKDVVLFTVLLHQEGANRLGLKLHVGPGDSAEPVLTLMLPHQD